MESESEASGIGWMFDDENNIIWHNGAKLYQLEAGRGFSEVDDAIFLMFNKFAI